MSKVSLFQALRKSGDAKEKGTGKVGGAGKFPPVLFSCLRFFNSADPTISEPGTG